MSQAPQPVDAAELLSRANASLRQNRLAEALDLYSQIVGHWPDHFLAFNNYGVALERLSRFDAALASFDRALSIKPDYAEAFYNRGIVLLKIRRFDQALASYDQALAIRPDYAEAWANRGVALIELNRLEEALADFTRSLALKADYAEAFYNRGIALTRLERLEPALADYDSALAIVSDYPGALANRGIVLQVLRRHEEALAVFEQVLAVKPNDSTVLSALTSSALETCDWKRTAAVLSGLDSQTVGRSAFIAPFQLLFCSADPSLQLECARRFAASTLPAPPPRPSHAKPHHDKIRIGYLSADFRNHPMAYLTAELFELHDRSRFEVTAISFGPEDRSGIRARIVKAFDRFYDVRARSDRDIAALMEGAGIDIAIDLMGHTRNARTGILAHRPAAIQVSYLGFPGTMGVDYIDYVLADRVVLPFDQQAFYTEKIVHLPDTYWVNDSKSDVPECRLTRREAGLPEQGFVFCCFNKSAKITAPVFDVWMRLLANVEGSVLWLLLDNAVAERNLRREAAARGIDPNRLVFADRMERDRHLARHRLADLFLDTLPYNAHTTAIDALLAGLPLVTCLGSTFSGRVAASLLSALGLSELITPSLAEYEALAIRLVGDAEYRARTVVRLEQNRANFPLFDTDRFRRHLESAYQAMWQRRQRGEGPANLTIPPQSVGGPLVD
jgi:protein O-GlcNAc transferase